MSVNQKKGHLAQLNDVLFDQIDRLCDPEKTGDALADEIARSKAVSGLARDVISNSRLILDANREAVVGKVAKAAEDTCGKLLDGGE